MPESPAQRRVLIAEDNPVNRRLTERMLDRLGYVYDVAIDGFQVLELLKHSTYHVLLMDLDMPGLDGLEATRRIRNDPSYTFVPRIVAVTSRQGDRARVLCLATGMNEFLSKPVSADDLQRAIEGRPTAQAEQRELGFLQRIQELQELGGDAFLGELIALFFSESSTRLDQAAAHLDAGRSAEAGRIFHQLQGSAANVGALELHATCGVGEEACAEGDGALAADCRRLALRHLEDARRILDAVRQGSTLK